jgi:hypothetical protein
MKNKMNFIKDMYEEGLVEKTLDEDAWADIRARRIERLERKRNIALYGYLVGLTDAPRAAKFVDYVMDGKFPPRQFLESYAPIIEMIDDIIEGGPAHVSQLKLVHKRAKQRKK